MLEVRKDGLEIGDLYEQYVWSLRYIDAPVLRDRDTTGNGELNEHMYYLNDANMNVTTLVNQAGAVQERYEYDPYGKATIYNVGWTATIAWADSKKNEILYCGYRYDPESNLYHVRRRMYHIYLAWVQREPFEKTIETSMHNDTLPESVLSMFVKKRMLGGASRGILEEDARAGQYHDSMNLYLYVRANPTNHVDPNGTKVGDHTNIYHLRGWPIKYVHVFLIPVRHTVLSWPGKSMQKGADFAPAGGKAKLKLCFFGCKGQSKAPFFVLKLKQQQDFKEEWQLCVSEKGEKGKPFLRYPDKPKKICCKDAAVKQIEECIIKVSREWNKKTFYTLGGTSTPNCIDFVVDVESACCLKPCGKD